VGPHHGRADGPDIANLKAVLSRLADARECRETTVYLTDMADFAQFNECYAKHIRRA